MFLRRKYGLFDYIETGPGRQTAKDVRARVREAEGEMWQSAMLPKATLSTYRENKTENATEPALCDNSCGGTLLFEARAGALRTLDYRSRFDCAPETRAAVCRSCGDERETIEHLLLRCSKLTPPPADAQRRKYERSSRVLEIVTRRPLAVDSLKNPPAPPACCSQVAIEVF
ncbi:hypothetical protein HPB50_027715 [Hyalomma asiaticum]|nr:hypothetical protein HPB50_027715 [Hyalomma asiaticum]